VRANTPRKKSHNKNSAATGEIPKYLKLAHASRGEASEAYINEKRAVSEGDGTGAVGLQPASASLAVEQGPHLQKHQARGNVRVTSSRLQSASIISTKATRRKRKNRKKRMKDNINGRVGNGGGGSISTFPTTLKKNFAGEAAPDEGLRV